MTKPILCVTHPRACSTAFERVFMTRTQDLVCFHEPFSHAFYFGPERMSPRYQDDEAERIQSGAAEATYSHILDLIQRGEKKGKRPFIKDMAYYFVPPLAKSAQIAPSLVSRKRGIGTQNGSTVLNGTSGSPPFPYGTKPEPDNPTIVPVEVLKLFHLTFLIRDPHSSIPSFYRCTVPPIQEITKNYRFDPAEGGYKELRTFLDYVVSIGLVSPKRAEESQKLNGHATNGDRIAKDVPHEMCLIDADDLLDNPPGIIQEYCKSIGLKYDESMLEWDDKESETTARDAFEKWKGWHDDALDSQGLKPRAHKKKQKTEEEWDAEWKAKYGEAGAEIIRAAVDENMADYLYLKQFAVKL